jgi:hypothetical protein
MRTPRELLLHNHYYNHYNYDVICGRKRTEQSTQLIPKLSITQQRQQASLAHTNNLNEKANTTAQGINGHNACQAVGKQQDNNNNNKKEEGDTTTNKQRGANEKVPPRIIIAKSCGVPNPRHPTTPLALRLISGTVWSGVFRRFACSHKVYSLLAI